MKNIAEQYGWTHMEMLKQQLYFLSKQSVDKHNEPKLHTWKLNVLYERKKKTKKVCFHKKNPILLLLLFLFGKRNIWEKREYFETGKHRNNKM